MWTLDAVYKIYQEWWMVRVSELCAVCMIWWCAKIIETNFFFFFFFFVVVNLNFFPSGYNNSDSNSFENIQIDFFFFKILFLKLKKYFLQSSFTLISFEHWTKWNLSYEVPTELQTNLQSKCVVLLGFFFFAYNTNWPCSIQIMKWLSEISVNLKKKNGVLVQNSLMMKLY